MDLRLIAPSDEPRLREAYELGRRSALHGREDSPHWSWQEMAGTYRYPDSGERVDLFGGYVDDRLVGVVTTYLPLLDNTEKGWVEVDVDPVERRRGHGSALLEAGVQHVRALGRSLVVTELKTPAGAGAEHGYRRFAERHGFTLGQLRGDPVARPAGAGRGPRRLVGAGRRAALRLHASRPTSTWCPTSWCRRCACSTGSWRSTPRPASWSWRRR